MAFTSSSLSALAYGNGFTLWHYITPDSAATVDTTGYFNNASGQLRVGDMIVLNVATGGTMQTGLGVVAFNSGGVVDIADMTRLDGTNTD